MHPRTICCGVWCAAEGRPVGSCVVVLERGAVVRLASYVCDSASVLGLRMRAEQRVADLERKLSSLCHFKA